MAAPVETASCTRCGATLPAPIPGRPQACPQCGARPGSVQEINEQLVQLAARLRLMSPEQAAQALADHPGGGHPGAPFMAAGLLTGAQVARLLATLRFKDERVADNRFGTLAITHGWATSEQIASALEEQKRLFMQENRPVLLGALLVARDVLTREQCDALLAEQRRVSEAPAEPPPVPAPAPTPVRPPGSIEINLSIAPDRLSASVNLPADAPLPSPAELRRAIGEFGVCYGVDEETINRLCAGELPAGTPTVVARGLVPIPPVDGRIEYFFDTHPLKGARETDEGIIDFRDRGDIPQVAAGAILARRTPPVPGQGGVDVLGVAIPEPAPKDPQLTVAKGAEITEDRRTVIAKVGGHPALSATGMVSVYPEYTIKGDLGYSTGHVDFEGRVVVMGIVQSGFKVRCGELIAQEVGGAEVEAEGDVTVSGGIIGGHILSGGSVRARYAHQARLEVMGNVEIQREVVDCEIETSGEFQAPRCVVLSSSIAALLGVYAKEIGSETSTPCKLEVGVDERVQHETARIEGAMADKRAACEGYTVRMAEADKRRAELDVEIGKAAQVQDKAMVRRRELQKARAEAQGAKAAQLDTEIAQLGPQIARVEAILNQLFSEQDRHVADIDAAQAALTADTQAIVALQAELDQLRAWAREHPGIPVVAADSLHQQTCIRSPHTETRISVDRKRVRLEERELTDRDGRSFWQMADVAASKRKP